MLCAVFLVDHCVDVERFLANKGKNLHLSVNDTDLVNTVSGRSIE
jgi:hypothetical protein